MPQKWVKLWSFLLKNSSFYDEQLAGRKERLCSLSKSNPAFTRINCESGQSFCSPRFELKKPVTSIAVVFNKPSP